MVNAVFASKLMGVYLSEGGGAGHCLGDGRVGVV